MLGATLPALGQKNLLGFSYLLQEDADKLLFKYFLITYRHREKRSCSIGCAVSDTNRHQCCH
jgi:hypothetical protein